ncbi:MAG: PDZ domain-containing protein [Clostridia bacterium]|nr:PDZ domain-containing protein [Clostridia bacterium]
MISRKYGRPSWVQTVCMCLIAAMLGALVAVYLLKDDTRPVEPGAYPKLDEIRALLDAYYVGSYTDQELMDMLSAGAMAGINDKWAYYTPAEDLQTLTENSSGRYTGIGVAVSLDTETGMLRVLEVYENSPAAEVGIRPMDLLYKVNGEYVAELGQDMTVSKVRGEEGTTVELSVLRNGVEIKLTVERRNVVKTSVYAEIIDGNIGYLRITDFTEVAAADFVGKLSSLYGAGVEGVIFDLRNNPGGRLSTLLTMLDEICPEGDLFIEEDNQGNRRVIKTVDNKYYKGNFAVLVNAYSYSAAEYFGAVLQEKGIATVVGERTTGKGEAQSTFVLSDGSAVTFSVLKYFTPAGVRISEKGGILPDIEIEMDQELAALIGKVDKTRDTQLAAAIDVVKKMIGQ